jgi:glycosyltransferase involved in cell wall biosynthesis
MLIRSICLVKNECDIIAQSLAAAAEWSDFIYVYDNGSTDGTWEAVVEVSSKYRHVIPFRREDAPFADSLRRVPFNHYRRQSSSGDWWCILDADEFYIDQPKEFLASVPTAYDSVWSASFQFYLTEKDVDRFSKDPAQYGDNVPVEQKCRYYINNWSELRFFKHSSRLRWASKKPSPFPLMRAYERRIRLKHYQYRSPQQIEKRLATRHDAIKRGIFNHESHADWAQAILGNRRGVRRESAKLSSVWTERVVSSSELICDDRSNYVVTESLLPKILDSSATRMARLKCRLYRAIANVFPS